MILQYKIKNKKQINIKISVKQLNSAHTPAVSRLFLKCSVVKEYLFIMSCPEVTIKGRLPVNVRIQDGT